MEWYNLIGVVTTLSFGIYALIRPLAFSKFVSLTPYKEAGLTEIRSTYGGWIIGFAAFTLYAQSKELLVCLSMAWFATAAVRTIFMIVDKSYSSKSLYFIIGEILIGTLIFM